MRSFLAMRSSSANSANINIRKRAWFHCASLGEYEQTVPVIESYKKLHPETNILLTFFSPSGYFPLLQNQPKWFSQGDLISSLPLDTPRRVRAFLNSTAREVKFFASCKYEVWPELMKQLSESNIPSFVFATHFTPKSAPLINSLPGRFLLRAWSRFDMIFTQDESSSSLLKLKGLNSVVAGDPRADRVLSISKHSRAPENLKAWKGDANLVLAGSSWFQEEGALASVVWTENRKLMIAPHEIHSENIDRILSLFPQATRYSSKSFETNIIVIDSIGLLSSLYSLADIAVVGGGYGKGIHNVLEPAAFGVPMITGPKINRFREAVLLKQHSALHTAATPLALTKKLKALLAPDNTQQLKRSGDAALSFVTDQTGSAEKISSYLP